MVFNHGWLGETGIRFYPFSHWGIILIEGSLPCLIAADILPKASQESSIGEVENE